ncbi:hypothetical protein VTK56DRAFT_3640 [Thermocarpiscus australiensis]
MFAKSSLFPRLQLPSGDGPILPLHNPKSPVRKKPSEYDLSELSPRPDDQLLAPETMNSRKRPPYGSRSPSPSTGFSDRSSNPGSASKSKSNARILFAGPPPPIATSRVLYRDEEEKDTSAFSNRNLGSSSLARSISSVLFDRGSSPGHTGDRDYEYKPDTIWLSLQRRERALQKELQHLLDAQSAGLTASLEPSPHRPQSSSTPGFAPSVSSDAGGSSTSITPTGTLPPDSAFITTAASSSSSTPRRVTSTASSSSRTPTGDLLPVRQPRPKPPSLRAARTGLTRAMVLLADLKAEEDATLAAALGARKQALAQLRRLAAKRAGIARELRALEGADGEEEERGQPLGRELRELVAEREAVGGEIAALEERLAELRRRKRWLDGRVEEVRNEREAELSGYQGALREVEGRIGGLLRRPGVRPLDVDSFSHLLRGQGNGNGGEDLGGALRQSIGGVEFLRLRPERRTVEMAREWWEGEVALLERRKAEVDRERAALEEGVEVWKGAVKLVSEFEAGLRREMRGGGDAMQMHQDKGKAREGDFTTRTAPPAPEQAMYAQLDKMGAVITGLEERLHVAEEKGWNLLVCAIGAELEAFRQAESLLREALRAAGVDDGGTSNGGDDDEGESTPHLGRSASLRDVGPLSNGLATEAGPWMDGDLADPHKQGEEDKAAESDNEVPADLLVAAAAEENGLASPALSRENSENEVPIEFLTEHRLDEGYPSLGAMS